MKTRQFFQTLLALAIGWAVAFFAVAAQAGVSLTDSAVFSSNNEGENWNDMIWNTQGAPDIRWNLYYSSSTDPDNPVFINAMDDESTQINLHLNAGIHTFLVFGDSTGMTLDPQQHFVANLYFEGNQGAPDISGLYGPDCPTVCAASHPNGLDLFGNSGLGGNLDAQEAGTLSFLANGYLVELITFTWELNPNVDAVWPHWGDTPPFDTGNGRPDFVGLLQLRVTEVPEPLALGLMVLGLGVTGALCRRRRS